MTAFFREDLPMNIMSILVSMSLLCGGVALYVAAENRKPELRRIRCLLSAIFCLSVAVLPASAQKVVHARAGQVVAINAARKTITLKAADGSTVIFNDVAAPEPVLQFAKEIREKTTPAAAFNKVGDQVVVFYFGFDTPTAVAIKDLGAGAIARSTGNVANFEKHQRLLTLNTDAAPPRKLVLNDDTVVDTSNGIVRSADYHPSKGEPVRCISGLQKDTETALLIGPN
jgi:hypothetical protein